MQPVHIYISSVCSSLGPSYCDPASTKTIPSRLIRTLWYIFSLGAMSYHKCMVLIPGRAQISVPIHFEIQLLGLIIWRLDVYVTVHVLMS